MLDARTFAAAIQCTPTLAVAWAARFNEAAETFQITGQLRAAMFLAQIGHESQGLTRLVESLNYSTKALLTTFGRHRISEGDAYRYGRNDLHAADQEMLANLLYGGDWGAKNLGNTEPDDGWKFRGQGPKQITGRANARACRDRLRVRLGNRVPDFEAEPHLLCTPEWGMMAAADFWHANDLNRFADRGDVVGCTKVINGGDMGLEDRRQRYEHALKVLA